MKFFRLVLVFMFLGILGLTINAINLQGINLFKYAVLTGWQGQFNYDFICYLMLSAVWVGWRYNFFSSIHIFY